MDVSNLKPNRSNRERQEEPRQQRFIPFAGTPTWRSNSTKDQRFINVYIEQLSNPLTGGSRLYVIKRPGLSSHSRPPNDDAVGRGIYFWRATNSVYSVFANKIYKGTSDLGVTMATSTGRVWFTETPAGFGGGRRLLVSDGTDLYSIDSSDNVTTIDENSDPQFPTNNLGPVLFFDSYIFLAKRNGQIWNSDVDTITDWSSSSFLSTEMYGDILQCIARQRDQIIAFGEMGLEFFYDNANASGSPLLRIDQNAIQIGITDVNTFAQSGELIMFVGQHYDEEPTVWLIDGLSTVKKVSTPAVERLLREEPGFASCRAFLIRSQGHMFYFLNLNTANRTLVYDVTMDIWTEAADASGNKFNCVAGTAKDEDVYLQDATNGRIYTFDPAVYRDNGSDFTVTLQLARNNQGIPYIKHCHGINIHGDLTTGNLAVSYSDDDYNNFNTARNIDLSTSRRFLPRLGSYYDRAWKFTYTGNFPLRLEGYTEYFDIGTI